jgi:hypothetical protein
MMANADVRLGIRKKTLGVVTALPNVGLTAPRNVGLAHATQARK